MIKVTKETYKKVFERDNGCCVVCYHEGEDLNLHQIKTRGNRKLINEVDNCIMLCSYHHEIAHHNMKHWQPIFENYIRLKEEAKNGN